MTIDWTLRTNLIKPFPSYLQTCKLHDTQSKFSAEVDQRLDILPINKKRDVDVDEDEFVVKVGQERKNKSDNQKNSFLLGALVVYQGSERT